MKWSAPCGHFIWSKYISNRIRICKTIFCRKMPLEPIKIPTSAYAKFVSFYSWHETCTCAVYGSCECWLYWIISTAKRERAAASAASRHCFIYEEANGSHTDTRAHRSRPAHRSSGCRASIHKQTVADIPENGEMDAKRRTRARCERQNVFKW